MECFDWTAFCTSFTHRRTVSGAMAWKWMPDTSAAEATTSLLSTMAWRNRRSDCASISAWQKGQPRGVRAQQNKARREKRW